MTQPITESNDPSGLAQVASRLDAVDAALADANKKNSHRNIWLAVLSIVSIIFLVFYLGYAYQRYGGDVTPELVAANAQQMFESSMPSARQQLETNLKNNAPQYVDKMVDQLQDMPNRYADELDLEANRQMDQATPQISDQLYKALQQQIETAKQTPGKGTDEDRLQALLASLSQVYADETAKFVDQTHTEYATQAIDFTNYLDRLASNKDLNHRDQMHREMFQSMMQLIRERNAQSDKTNQLDISLTKPAQ